MADAGGSEIEQALQRGGLRWPELGNQHGDQDGEGGVGEHHHAVVRASLMDHDLGSGTRMPPLELSREAAVRREDLS